MDPYAVLGVQRGADLAEIKAAYRRLMLQHHPDKGGDVEVAKRINRAYELLWKPQPAPLPVPRYQRVVRVVIINGYRFEAVDFQAANTTTYTAGFGVW